MAKSATVKPVLALSIMAPDQLFRPGGSGGFDRGEGDFHLYPVTIGPRPGDYDGENIGASDVRSPDDYHALNRLWLRDFSIHTYFRQPATGREVWGWSLWCKPFTIDSAREADNIAQTFATIDKRAEKVRELNGHPATFDQYVAQMAQAMGCTRIVLRSRDRHIADRIVSLGEGIETLRHYLRQWQEAGEALQATA